MDSKLLVIGIIVILIAVGAFFLFSQPTEAPPIEPEPEPESEPQPEPEPEPEPGPEPETKELTMVFSSKECDDSINPYNKSNLGISEISQSGTSLTVKAIITKNCAVSVLGGDYEVQDNRLLLSYELGDCDPCTSCMCAAELTYEFNNLEGNGSEIILQGHGVLLDMDSAVEQLEEGDCWYDLTAEDVCMDLEDSEWVVWKEGCGGKCRVDANTGKVTLDANPMCTGLAIPCSSDLDCNSTTPTCASEFVCDSGSCVPIFND